MDKRRRAVVWFEEVNKNDIAIAGGKGANLGELLRSSIPVPNGFIVTADAYVEFIESTDLRNKIQGMLDPLDSSDTAKLQQTAEEIKKMVMACPMPPQISRSIKQHYAKLGGGRVAVRSSATAEDLPDASFAGQQRTYLNIQGEDDVVLAVQGCWASLFEPRAIFYRVQQGFDHFQVNIAVPVQNMVQSEVSGVMFTLDPLTNDRSKVVIEAVFGLGESIVSGEVTPDLYIIDKATLSIVEHQKRRQEWTLAANPRKGQGLDNNIKVPIPQSKQDAPKLADGDVLALARMGMRIENLYQFPQDIEWGREGRALFILQARPVTALDRKAKQELPAVSGNVLLTGVAASPGVASGQVRVLPDPSLIHELQPGEILVAQMTTPDYVPAMKKAAAIITDKGGRTAHAAIVSRELGIPCVVGTNQATESLVNGQVVTVDGFRGKVYEGQVIQEKISATVAPVTRRKLVTKTKVYVNLAEPKRAPDVAKMDCDGVGLLRAEFIIADHIGEHPRFMLKHGRGNLFSSKLAEGISIFAKAFYPRPVVYRTTDFKTNEYRSLRGGEEFEEKEENPMIGYRGASRYVREIDVLRMEIAAIKKIRESYSNLWVMIPFVRTIKEMAETKRILEAEGLVQSSDFKLWMMAEVPSNVFLIEEFLNTGINGVSIGSNDLTQLVLGVDRDNSKLADVFDERDEAVGRALEKIIKTCASRGVTASICGQAPSVYPELTEKLVKWGITSVSVSPDMIDTTRELIADVEARLVRAPMSLS